MRRVFIICAVLLAFSGVSNAQDRDSESPPKYQNTEMLMEFGLTGECETGAILDNFLITLQNNPTLLGVVISYKGKNILPSQYNSASTRLYEDHIRLRGFDRNRVVFIDGGFRHERATELWLVPPGGAMPQVSNAIPKPELPKNKTFLYDKNYLGSDIYGYWFGDNYTDEFLLPAVKVEREAEQADLKEELQQNVHLDEEESESYKPTPEEIENEKFAWTNGNFGEILKDQKNSTGVIIFYADDQTYDINAVRNFINQGRDHIAEVAEISPSRIQVIFGGFRHWIETEFWIMPKNGEFPAATPEERPVEETDEEINAEDS